MSLISIDSELHWGISFPEGQHTSIWISSHIWDMDTKLLSFGKLDIGYFMENSSALCPGSATLDRFWMEHRREVFLIRWNVAYVM
jgi:hypothetical protein